MNDLHEKNTGRIHPNKPNVMLHLGRAITALEDGDEDRAYSEIQGASACFAPHGTTGISRVHEEE